jgi:acyl-CoA thioester hydrolase
MSEPHRIAVRVYYEDTDLAGLVYYANYLKFIERGRTEALRAAGVDQSALRAQSGLVFVVSRIEADYLRPAAFDDLLDVESRVLRLGAASVELDQRIARAGQALFRARVRLACIDGAGRPARLPAPVRVALEGLLKEEDIV